MRKLFILMFAVNLGLTLVSLLVLPARVAIHFGANGMANNWAPNHVNAILMTVTHVIIFCGIYFGTRIPFFVPQRWINLPNREYWLSPQNKELALAKVQDLLWHIGAVIFLLLFALGLLSLKANLSDPVRMDPRIVYPALGAFLVYTVCWTVFYFRAFRVPGVKT